MPSPTNFDERLMEALELGMLELRIVEAEEVVHDDVARKSGKRMREVQRLFPGFKFLHADAEGVNVAVDDVDEVED
jgi:hypothetical protein